MHLVFALPRVLDNYLHSELMHIWKEIAAASVSYLCGLARTLNRFQFLKLERIYSLISKNAVSGLPGPHLILWPAILSTFDGSLLFSSSKFM